MNLDEGLFLEMREARLAWGLSFDELRATVPPDVWVRSKELPPADRICWNDSIWGGLRCQIRTSYGGPGNRQKRLRGLRISFSFPEAIRSAPFGFQWLQSKLEEQFGSPKSFRDDGTENGEAVWQQGRTEVRHEYFNGMGGHHEVVLRHASD